MSRHSSARPLRRLILTAAVLAAAVGAPARAQPPEDDAPAAQEPAFVISAALTADAWANVTGGVRTGGTTLNNIGLVADLDVEQLAGLSGATARVSLLHNNRRILSSDLVGDIQGVSNMDTPIGALRLYEAWIETMTGCAAVKAGLLNLNEEFDTNPIGALFTNSSHGIGPDLSQVGPNGPGIFSVSGLGARIGVSLSETLLVKLG